MRKHFVTFLIALVFAIPTSVRADNPAFGAAGDYNVFVFGDVTHQGGDSEGAMAVGGNAFLTDFGIGQDIDADESTLVVGGNLAFEQGEVHHGNIHVGGQAALAETVGLPDGELKIGSQPVNFEEAQAYLMTLSAFWADLDENGEVSLESGSDKLVLTGENDVLNIFAVSTEQWFQAKEINVDVPEDATVLINVDVEEDIIPDMHERFGQIQVKDKNKTLWHFPNATSLSLSNVSWQGTLFAPKADFSYQSGNVEGQLIVNNLAMTENSAGVKYYPFTGDIPSPFADHDMEEEIDEEIDEETEVEDDVEDEETEEDTEIEVEDEVATPSTVEEEDDAVEEEAADEENGESEVIQLEIIVEGYVYDEGDRPLVDAEVRLGDDFTGTTDEKGYYQLVGLSAGTFDLTAEKEGYVFDTIGVTLDDENPVLEVNLKPIVSSKIEGHNLIVVGAHSCDSENNIVSLMTLDGELVHRFGTGFTGKGIRISSADFDEDNSTDVAASEVDDGNDVLIFDAKGKQFVKIVTNADKKGVNAVFGDIDGDGASEIVVSNQAKGDRIYLYESDGTAIRAIPVFDKKADFTIATGDVNGDGTDEIIVTNSKAVKDENVHIFDSEGNVLSQFAALTVKDKALGIIAATGDLNNDGKADIIVGQADKKDNYTVGVYDMNGNVVMAAFNAFGSVEITDIEIVEDDEEESDDEGDDNDRKDDCKLYKGEGVLLASGDLDGDDRDDIIVAKNGGQEVRVYTADGTMLNYFDAINKEATISGLSFGANMAVELPVMTELPADDEPLEDITIVGTADNPVRIEDREIKGTVNITNTIINNINVHPGARLVVGPGVKFKDHRKIPVGLNLTRVFPKIHVSSKIKEVEITDEPLDLSKTSVIEGDEPILEDIEVMLEGGQTDLELEQDSDTGSIQMSQDDLDFAVYPTEVRQAEADEVEGIHVTAENTVKIITLKRQVVILQPVIQEFAEFSVSLKKIKLGKLKMKTKGMLVSNHEVDNTIYLGKPDIMSMPAEDSLDYGMISMLHPVVKNYGLSYFVFKDKKSKKKKKQIVYPLPYNFDLLSSLTELDTNATEVKFEYGGVISFKIGGKKKKCMMDYHVTSGKTPKSGKVEFELVGDQNADGIDDYDIVYPDGKRQKVYRFE